MTDVIFGDFFLYIKEKLLSAKSDVKIAVAWLNFKLYGSIFERLMDKGVKLYIVINDDYINARNDDIIESLKNKGASIYKRKMPTSKQYMHEKFCIIDNNLVLNGSYNWSLNANNNFENLMISDKKLVIEKFNMEFYTIVNMDVENIKKLQKCNCYNIMVFIENDYSTAVGIIYNIKDGELFEIGREYYEISVLTNLEGIYEKYDCAIELLYDYPYELKEIDACVDFEIHQYLSAIRNTKTSVPIHGIGKVAREYVYPDDENIFIKIIWKEKFCIIEDEYEIN